MLESSHTKRLSHKLCEGEICERLEEMHRKQATDEGAQNATPVRQTPDKRINATSVEEMLCNHSKSDPLNATQALKMRPPVEEHYVTAQKTLRRRFQSKTPHLGAHGALELARERDASAQMQPLPRKRHLGAQKTSSVDEIAPAWLESEPRRIKCI